jgi:O-antigen/teichoic acid export membrane protein
MRTIARSARSGLRNAVSKSYLPLGRLTYAGTSGLSLLIATQISPNLSIVGEYVYQIGYASAIATVAGFGLDRIMARRMSSGEMKVGFPREILAFRLILLAAIVISSLALGMIFDQILVFGFAGFFVVSRVFYADLESVWIGARLGDKSLFAALIVNGIVTGAGIVGGSLFSSAAMMGSSSLGNVIALGILLSRNRLSVRPGAVPGLVREARGISLSLLLAIVYARVDLVILAALGAPLQSVALYGVITRVFDALALVRGSVAQYEARDISSLRLRTKARRLRSLSMRTQSVVIPIGVIGVLVLWIFASNHVLLPAEINRTALAMAFSALPLFFSHLPTTAMIYSDRRTHRLLLGSLITCAGSIGLKWCLISAGGLSGAIFAIGAVELLSCLVFYLLYWENARNWASSRTVWVPLGAGFLLAGASILIA